MPNTYSQIYIHNVFAVKYREGLIQSRWKDELYKYITGIVQKKGNKMIEINGVEDHIHFMIGMKPTIVLSDLIRDVKTNSTAFVKSKFLVNKFFEWQDGYGAFSCSRSEIGRVAAYISNQEEHHKKISFREEYEGILQSMNIDFDPRFIFSEPI